MTVSVYVVHADAEARLAEELQAFLKPQIRKGRLSLSGRFALPPSADAALAESEGIAAADIVVLLVSQRLLNDRDEAIQLAMVRSKLQLAPVIPVLVSAANLRDSAFAGLVSLPRERPGLVAQFDDRDRAWLDVASGVLAVVDETPARRRRRQEQAESAEGKVRVLFASANPSDTSRLQVSREIAQVRGRLEQLGLAAGFDLIDRRDVDLGDLASALAQHRPQVVHFSGHSKRDGALVFQGLQGEAAPVADVALRQLFTGLPARPRLLLLNTCFAGSQASALEGVVDAFIGHLEPISDVDAIAYADILYMNLANGRSVQEAHQQAQAALVGRTRSVLRCPTDVDPAQIRVCERGS